MRDPRPRKGEGVGSEVPPPTVTPVLVAELLAEGERMPVYVHVIDHPEARVLVDTGMTQLHPAVADMDPRLIPLSAQGDFDLAGIDVVINTHLHFDHCGGNHLFAGRPIYVQRRELDDARPQDDYTIRDWSRHQAIRRVHRRSWSSRTGAPSSSAGTWRSSSPSSTSRATRASR